MKERNCAGRYELEDQVESLREDDSVQETQWMPFSEFVALKTVDRTEDDDEQLGDIGHGAEDGPSENGE
ncbi:hypothetical protein BBJ28_00002365 [Nothophytophthora sp. Chile5]|nr:hypothetical protein BBJ28_00002365 [Nothophytophthora sp. Chile5]